ncbi:winged helix-turn-helix transcriptional regulator [Catenulispora rubra]|uniref:winged helix-turn-helix transcriptional regulator n=1 Tax=Catenulispora rubra TaxID=280293 RepID=UPI0018922574|nr:helix-turn-helix domain-containing protein [Catenulispora rubra]
MRSYGQHCSIAKALDLVGERWTLLIVRELLLQGPCRFTDLRNGLPGIASNLLSGRLKELEENGLISRNEAPPPIATTLYALTPRGVELGPVLKALGTWGVQYYLADNYEEDAARPYWEEYAESANRSSKVEMERAAREEGALKEGRPAAVEGRP